MTLASIFALALGVSLDAMAVSASRGLLIGRLRLRHFAAVVLWFGLAQALMPLLGSLLGQSLGRWVSAWDHWVAFVLLAAVGVHMLYEAAAGDHDADEPSDPFASKTMALLALATSIDALAVGVTLPMLGAPILSSCLTIGFTTAICSALGLLAGRRFGALLGPRLDALGGIVLIGLGAKILLEHLW